MLQATMGGNRAWMWCLLSQRLEPEILHLTHNSGGGWEVGFMPGQQPAEAPALGKWEWPPRTHHKPVWFGSKPGPMWPRPHRMDRGQNGKSTCRNSKQSSCSLLSAQHVAGWAESFTWDYNSGPPTGSVPSQVIRSHIRTGPQVRLIPELMATCKVHKAYSCPLAAQSSGETDPKQR